MKRHGRGGIVLVLLFAGVSSTEASEICTSQSGGITQIKLCGGEAFHATSATVSNAQLITISGTPALVAKWEETAGGATRTFSATSHNGSSFLPARLNSNFLRLKAGSFDPLAGVFLVDSRLQADESNRLWVVQFVAPSCGEFRRGIVDAGGLIRGFIPEQGHIVEGDEAMLAQIQALSYVRWAGALQPANKLPLAAARYP